MPGSTSSTPRAGRELTPTQRMQRAQAKIKAREQMRIERSAPGPGAYDTKRATSTADQYIGSRAFKSATLRHVAVGPEPLRDKTLHTDPGAYDHFSNRDLAAKARNSFAKSAQKGSNEFGSKSKRALQMAIMGEENPSPAEYGGGGAKKGLYDVVASSRIKSWAFTTTSKQRIALQGKDEKEKPSPLAYDVDRAAIEPKVKNAGIDFRSKTERFHGAMLFEKGKTTGEHLGPGHYPLADKVQTLAKSRELARSLGLGHAFRSESVRDISSNFFARERTSF